MLEERAASDHICHLCAGSRDIKSARSLPVVTSPWRSSSVRSVGHTTACMKQLSGDATAAALVEICWLRHLVSLAEPAG